MKKYILLTIALLCMVVQGACAQDCFARLESELSSLTGKNVYNLEQDGDWNTICLPFSIADLTGTPLEGATVMEFDVENWQTGYDGSTLYLFFKKVTEIEANKPYIIKWEKTEGTRGTEVAELKAPLKASGAIGVTSQDGYVTFQGTFTPVSIGVEGDKTILYLGDGNQLYWPNGAMTIGSFRAYFQLNGITVEDFARARMFFGEDDEATGIFSTTNLTNDTNSGAWYDLSGRRLSGKPTRPGIYIENGRKLVIK